ncbi:MAG TPA: hypothetical protein VFO40_18995 [Chthoniobacterales bacterium]|nr:hypothetical protein [Chthoniobacterales bacterium]
MPPDPAHQLNHSPCQADFTYAGPLRFVAKKLLLPKWLVGEHIELLPNGEAGNRVNSLARTSR